MFSSKLPSIIPSMSTCILPSMLPSPWVLAWNFLCESSLFIPQLPRYAGLVSSSELATIRSNTDTHRQKYCCSAGLLLSLFSVKIYFLRRCFISQIQVSLSVRICIPPRCQALPVCIMLNYLLMQVQCRCQTQNDFNTCILTRSRVLFNNFLLLFCFVRSVLSDVLALI